MSESEQDDYFFAKYQEIRQQLSEIDNFFNDEVRKNFSTQMTDNYEFLQRIARSNYVKIFSFDKYLPLPVSEEQLIESFVRNDVKMISLAPQPAVFQTTSACIKYIYQKKLYKPLAETAFSYFTARPEELPIFAYITFPALYGFFLSLDHLKYAFDFLSCLMTLNIKFSLPFFVAYLTSAHVFVDIFWDHFFELVNVDDRLKPSIAQLYEYIIKSLQYSANYLTPYHFLICTQCIGLDSKIFYDCFFKRFLLSTFNAWTSYNPSISSSKVTEEDLDILFTYFIENPEGRAVQEIETIITSNCFSYNELYSFVKNSSEKNFAYLLSPRELKLISQLFREIPDLKKVIFDHDNSSFKDIDFTSFVAGSFAVYFDEKGSNAEEEERLIFEEASESAKKLIKEGEESKTLECERAWNTIRQICEIDNKLDPFLMLMTCNKSDENDTIYEKIAKKKIIKKSSPALKKYVLGLYQKILVDKQNYFENFLNKQTFANMVNNMKLKLIRYGEIMEHLILPKLQNKDFLLSKKMFTKKLIIFEMFESEDCSKPSFIECQKNFFESLKHYSNRNPRLSNFLSSRDSFFLPLVLALAKADELSLGDRFFLLHNVYSQIAVITEPIGREKIFEDPSGSLNTLFAYLLVKANFRSFIKTYINVCSFKNKFKEKFDMFPPEIIEKWYEIQSFVMSVIQDEDFDIQSRLTIQTFSK